MVSEYDEQWRCRFGYWHVVPQLARDCSGVAHGLEADED